MPDSYDLVVIHRHQHDQDGEEDNDEPVRCDISVSAVRLAEDSRMYFLFMKTSFQWKSRSLYCARAPSLPACRAPASSRVLDGMREVWSSAEDLFEAT